MLRAMEKTTSKKLNKALSPDNEELVKQKPDKKTLSPLDGSEMIIQHSLLRVTYRTDCMCLNYQK